MNEDEYYENMADKYEDQHEDEMDIGGVEI